MELVVTCELHFSRTPDGCVWTDGQYPYAFWTRYLSVFESLRIISRIREIELPPPNCKRADGEGVSFSAVPDFLGPQQYLLRAWRVGAAVGKAIQMREAVILRVPGLMSCAVESRLRKDGRLPYGVEVVGDPYDVFAPGANSHPSRAFFRWWFTRRLRLQCVRACAAAYVTEHALQRRYPPAPGSFTTHYSSIDLPPVAFAAAPRPAPLRLPIRLIWVGTLAQLYKAPDVLVEAVAMCVRQGLDLELKLVGSGRHQAEVEERTVRLGINGRTIFLGQLTTPEAVREQLDSADVFVLPSRQEGLPRAMIEAMARALPCIGTTVGGIPELLPAEDLVPPDDPSAFARKIAEVAGDPQRMAKMSARNLEKAQEYAEEVLRSRRRAFYEEIRTRTRLSIANL